MKKLLLKEGKSAEGMPIKAYTEIDSADRFYTDEIETMVRVFKENGYEIDLLTAYSAHCAWDNDYMASWMELPADKDMVRTFLPYLTVVEE
jgi:hypothetical protein